MEPLYEVTVGDTLALRLNASDPDGDPLTWSIKSSSSLPAWAALTNRTEVTTLTGSGASGVTNDADPMQASFKTIWGITALNSEEIYIGEFFDFIIRRLAHDGVTTYVGDGTEGSVDGDRLSSSFGHIRHLTLDNEGNLIIADEGNNKIRKLDRTTGLVSTVATVSSPYGVVVDSIGNIYTASPVDKTINKIEAGTGIVTTFAGSGISGFDDANGTNASFGGPQGLAIDANDNIYVADSGNHAIRKITPSGDVITFAGTGDAGADNSADRLSASFNSPIAVSVDNDGNVYVLEYSSHRVRRIDAASGEVTTFAGDGEPTYKDSTNALMASFRYPSAMDIAKDGTLYIADRSNFRVRSVLKTTNVLGTPDVVDIGDANVCFEITDGLATEEHCTVLRVLPPPNEAPTAIQLVNYNLVAGYGAAEVGQLLSVDADNPAPESFTYSLDDGAGDTNNSLFSIAGDKVIASDYANLEAGSFSIRVQTDDGLGGVFSQAISISVAVDSDGDGVPDDVDSDPNDASVFDDTNSNGISDYQEANQTQYAVVTPRVITVLENQREVINIKTLNQQTAPLFSIVGGTEQALFQVNEASGKLSFIDKPDWDNPTDADRDNEYHVIVSATDNESGIQAVQSITVIVTFDPDEVEGGDSRADTVNGEIFLGGKNIELGISEWGDFGTEGSKPKGFYGTKARSNIGMSRDIDGFGQGDDISMDYFLPGSPEERFVVGYRDNSGRAHAKSNSAVQGAKQLSTTVQDISDPANKTVGAKLKSIWDDTLVVQQKITFDEKDSYFRNVVTLSNISDENMQNVRYMRSFDPDNTVDAGGGYSTENVVLYSHAAGDGKEVVQASTYSSRDPIWTDYESRSPIFFYSKDENVRVSIFGFSNTDPFVSDAWDSPIDKGNIVTSDTGITLTYNAETIPAGGAVAFVYYTSLDTADFDALEDKIALDEEDKGEPKPEPVITIPMLKIGGVPTDIALQGQPYSFVPVVTNPDSLDLTFSVENLPGWLSFNTATGELTGTAGQDDVGAHSDIVIKVSSELDDGTILEDSIVPFTILVNNANDAPVFTGELSPTRFGEEGQVFTYTPVLTDADSPDLAYFYVENLPGWAGFDMSTGSVSGTPDYTQAGEYIDIRIWAKDAAGALATNEVILDIDIADVNRAPTYTGSHVFAVRFGQSSVTTITATDIDGDEPRYSLYNSSNGADEVGEHTDLFEIDSISGELAFVSAPAFNAVPDNLYRVSIAIDDGRGGIEVVLLEVEVTNSPPVSNPDDSTMAEDGELIVDIIASAEDVDSGDVLTLSSVSTETGSAKIANNKLVYIPPQNFNGEVVINYCVTDLAGESSCSTVTVTVTGVNDVPVISGTPVTKITEGDSYVFTPEVFDADNDPLTLSINSLPDWLVFDKNTGTLSGTPAYDDVGRYNGLVITVSDGFSQASLPEFNIRVLARDTDGDGIADAEELACGMDINNPDDALIDSDGDGMANGEECYANQNPFVDDIAPVITLPDDVYVDADALFTRVELGKASATDFINGVNTSCCEPLPKSLIDGKPLFAPGTHEVIWQAQDEAGNIAESVQLVHVAPLVSVSKDQQAVEGVTVSIGVHLNGESPAYPLVIPYSVSGTAGIEDHDLVSGELTIESGMEGIITFSIFNDGVESEGSESVVVTLSDELNLGAKFSHTVFIEEENIAPSVSLMAYQAGEPTSWISKDAGEVTVVAQIRDVNIADTHTLEWLDTSEIDVQSASNKLQFDPDQLQSGLLTLGIQVSDSGEPSLQASAQLRLKVMDTAVVLGYADSDGDGITDIEEGTMDSDLDGLPDYLDSSNEPNVLPERVSEQQAYIVECNPGLSCRLGNFALFSEHQGVELTKDDITSNASITPDSFTNIGGVFDFEVHDLPSTGDTASIVLPQREAIPANAVYRKFIDGTWVDFVSDGDNFISSFSGEPGYCPPPGSELYQEGLNEGDWCVQVTIKDGGANDADGVENGVIRDPGGVAVYAQEEVINQNSGGSMSYISMLLLVVLAGLCRLPFARIGAALALLLGGTATVSAETNDDKQNSWFVSGDLGYVQSDTDIGNISSQMAEMNAGITFIDDERFGWKLGVGYQFTDYLAFSVEYIDLGEVEIGYSGNVPDSQAFYDLAGELHPISAQGVATSILLGLPITPQLKAQARLGAFFWEDDYRAFNVDGVKVASDSQHGTDGYFGLGVEWQAMLGLGVSLEWQHFTLPASNDMVSLGLKYYF
ncbi:putative Ig domain-containing protein [Shewanella submarina]|uniref:Ig domain-containing protein n=1 Tax=Shewanella submarina TaxID=2016376 RepID=A0ABV7GDS4_9GAMM|nr:putative Ig domain-containing protein [Shewanella submarina]MCL1039596.1 putative Ig domain-containing protein [Shewanella submarina]